MENKTCDNTSITDTETIYKKINSIVVMNRSTVVDCYSGGQRQ